MGGRGTDERNGRVVCDGKERERERGEGGVVEDIEGKEKIEWMNLICQNVT